MGTLTGSLVDKSHYYYYYYYYYYIHSWIH